MASLIPLGGLLCRIPERLLDISTLAPSPNVISCGVAGGWSAKVICDNRGTRAKTKTPSIALGESFVGLQFKAVTTDSLN
jgi:hypothetical protein